MAQKIVTTMVDDINGEAGDDVSTVRFGIDGIAYEMDLNDTNETTLRRLLAGFIAHARMITAAPAVKVKRARAAGTPKARSEGQAIRAWAAEQGIEVPARGRLSAEVRERYTAAHQAA